MNNLNMSDAIAQLEEVVHDLNTYNYETYGRESIDLSLGRSLGIVVNVFMNIINNLKSGALHPFRTLKRTELEAWKDARTATARSIVKSSKTLLTGAIPYPDGMTCTYLEGTAQIVNLLETMNMNVKSKLIRSEVDTLKTALLTGTEYTMSSLTAKLDDFPFISAKFTQMDKLFRGSKILAKAKDKPKTFTQLFKTDMEFETVYNELLASAKHQYGVSSSLSNLESINSAMENIYNAFKSERLALNKPVVTALAVVALSFAKLFDMYGILMQDLHRVEHNFVIILDRIEKDLE